MSQPPRPAGLPTTVRVGLYEEFPNPWRLSKLSQVDFPVTLAVAAQTRAVFLELRESIQRDYPQVREVFFWPLLKPEEGYYPGPLSDPQAVRRVEVDGAGKEDHFTPRSSTSKISVALGGMTPPAPRAP